VPAKLPQTASRMPLISLIGILSLTVAASFRILLKVRA
jgi:LPXTG-motif cell wall-anchored protein